MAIRLGNSCVNCENLQANEMCGVHKIQVSNSYTCDSFKTKAELLDSRNCSTCLRYEKTECANPQKATPGMLCSHWAPQNAMA